MKNQNSSTRGYHSPKLPKWNNKRSCSKNNFAKEFTHAIFKVGCCVATYYIGYYFWEKRLNRKEELRQEKAKTTEEKVYTENVPIKEEKVKVQTLQESINSAPDSISWTVYNRIRKGAIAVGFGQKGHGKSWLAKDFAYSIATGQPLAMFPDSKPTDQQEVILCDLELTDGQRKIRWYGCDVPSNVRLCGDKRRIEAGVLLNKAFEMAEERGRDCTIIIDNVTKFRSNIASREDVAKLYELMESIQGKAEESGYTITFILLAHTTKNTPDWKSLDITDVKGAGELTIQADYVFALGPTKLGEDYKLYKELNNRDVEELDGVIVVKRVKTPYMHLEYVDVCKEDDVRPEPPTKAPKPTVHISANQLTYGKAKRKDGVSPELERKMLSLKAEGMGAKKIAKICKKSVSTVKAHLKEPKYQTIG